MYELDDSKCEKCGRCCEMKLALDGKVLPSNVYCKFLDRRTMLCTVYANRHEAQPQCLSLPEAIAARILPDDCPYVREDRLYKCIIDYS